MRRLVPLGSITWHQNIYPISHTEKDYDSVHTAESRIKVNKKRPLAVTWSQSDFTLANHAVGEKFKDDTNHEILTWFLTVPSVIPVACTYSNFLISFFRLPRGIAYSSRKLIKMLCGMRRSLEPGIL